MRSGKTITFTSLFFFALYALAFADPIVTPRASLLATSLINLILGAEVLVTILYLRNFAFRTVRVIPVLFLMNILSFILFFFIRNQFSEILFFPLSEIVGELLVILLEGFIILGLSKVTWFRSSECLLPPGYAFRISIVSNLFSMVLGLLSPVVLIPILKIII